MDKELQFIDNMTAYFSDVKMRVNALNASASKNGFPALEEYSEDMLVSTCNLLDVLKDMRECALEAAGAVKVPVRNGDRPTLKLVVNNTKKEV